MTDEQSKDKLKSIIKKGQEAIDEILKLDEEYGNIPDGFLLNPEEVEELRKSKRELAAYATQKLRKLKAQQQTQELLNAAHRIADGGVPLGKLIREGHDDPMTTRVRYEYAALLRELINQCGYDNYNVDGDHGMLVINVRDVLGIIEVLEEMK